MAKKRGKTRFDLLLEWIADRIFYILVGGLAIYLFFFFFVSLDRQINGGNRVAFGQGVGYAIDNHPFRLHKIAVPNMEGNRSEGFVFGNWKYMAVHEGDPLYPKVASWVAKCMYGYGDGGTPVVENVNYILKLFGVPLFSYNTEDFVCRGDKWSGLFLHMAKTNNPFDDNYLKSDPFDYYYYKKRGATFDPKYYRKSIANNWETARH